MLVTAGTDGVYPAGLVVGTLDAPGAITLGTWVALAVTVPILGGPLAWVPVVAVTWAADIAPLPVAALTSDQTHAVMAPTRSRRPRKSDGANDDHTD